MEAIESEKRSEWSVYILRCSDDSLYTGITTDLLRRVDEHNGDNRLAARYTRSRRPVVLVYSEKCDNRRAALQREYAIKQLKRSDKEELIGCCQVRRKRVEMALKRNNINNKKMAR